MGENQSGSWFWGGHQVPREKVQHIHYNHLPGPEFSPPLLLSFSYENVLYGGLLFVICSINI